MVSVTSGTVPGTGTTPKQYITLFVSSRDSSLLLLLLLLSLSLLLLLLLPHLCDP